MPKIDTSIDLKEVAKFAQHAGAWWDEDGPFKTLHDINNTRLAFVSGHCPLQGLSVLDVGCGGGIFAEALAKAGAKVTGIDAEMHAIETAQVHAHQSKLSIDYYCTPIEQFNSDAFDVVTCMELLEHVPDPALILAHCHRLLKPQGHLFASTLNRTLKAYAMAIVGAEYLLGLLPRQTHDYSKFIKPSELTSMARGLGFNLLDVQGMSYNPFTRSSGLTKDVSVNYLAAFFCS
jgi:2-polyprenyl-6-hydroxyphenyl methylase/3-demethylubiquinone-9 3-methyltransferase